jgi:ABC-2 type transport system permease protein
MISKALLKRDIKISMKLWLVITGTMAGLLFLLMFSAREMSAGGSSIVSQFYTLFGPLLFVFFAGPTGNKLIAAQIDNGSFAYVMSAPLKRTQVAVTQAIFSIGSIAAMHVVFIIAGFLGNALFGPVIEAKTFLLLNLGSFLLSVCTAGIGYFASCLFNSAGKSISIGVGIPMAFVILNLMALIFAGNDLLKLCKYLTLNTLLNSSHILSCSTNMIWEFLIMLVIGAVLYVSGIVIFKKKDLPL